MPLAGEVERTLRTIFKRCLQCPPETPSCPSCPAGQICSLIPYDCNACAHMICVPNPQSAPKSSGPNVGAIAGGVIGGVAFMAVVMFFLWRFWIKKRREQQELEAEEWEDDDIAQQKAGNHFAQMRSDAASTRTRASLANSILSRASNIIQIAYIPGVTNRNGSSHNSLAPVPPVPAMYANSPKSPLSGKDDALFFRPESTWSASSSALGGNRDTQYTRKSITPSLASELYRDDATTAEPMPAVPVARVTPRMVSVKSSQSSSPAETPGSLKVMVPGQGSSKIGQSPLRNAGSYGKANEVTIGKGKGRFPVRQTDPNASPPSGALRHTPAVSSPLVDTSEPEEQDDHARAGRRSLQRSGDILSSPLSVQPAESPFFDTSDSPPAAASSASSTPNPYSAMSSSVGTDNIAASRRTISGLSAVIEEATKRASAAPSHDGIGGKRDNSPFGDEHATE